MSAWNQLRLIMEGSEQGSHVSAEQFEEILNKKVAGRSKEVKKKLYECLIFLSGLGAEVVHDDEGLRSIYQILSQDPESRNSALASKLMMIGNDLKTFGKHGPEKKEKEPEKDDHDDLPSWDELEPEEKDREDRDLSWMDDI